MSSFVRLWRRGDLESCTSRALLNVPTYYHGENMDKAIKTYISVLKAEVQHLKSKLEPTDTGHIHTTIGTLQHRIKELESKN